jgi:hypothetical protein
MGYDSAQTKRMMQKIANDPIMRLIVEKFNVNLIPISQVDFLQNTEFMAEQRNLGLTTVGEWESESENENNR